MKKIINCKHIFAALIFVSAPYEALASSWYTTNVGNNDTSYYFDAESVSRTKDVILVWIKTVQNYAVDTDGSWATAYRWKFNCTRKTIQTMASSTYDKDGKFIKSNTNPSGETEVIPDSTGEGMLRLTCAADFPKNKSEKDYVKVSDNDVFEATRRYVQYVKSKVDTAPK